MDAKLQEVLLDYGLEGYGLYWYCLELIAKDVEPENLTFELEHDCRIIARNTGSTSQKVQEMMTKFVELGLFENNSNVITCLKLAKVSDDYTAKLVRNNPPESRINAYVRQTPTKSEKVPLEQSKTDKTKTYKSKQDDTNVTIVLDHLNTVCGRNFSTSKEVEARLKKYTVDDLKMVIEYKAKQWMGTDMQMYLRPSTLFNKTKFEGYWNDAQQQVPANQQNQSTQQGAD